jgi:hypothetical protein
MNECRKPKHWTIKEITYILHNIQPSKRAGKEIKISKYLLEKERLFLPTCLYNCILSGTSLLASPASPLAGLGGSPTWASAIRAWHQFLRLSCLLIFLGIAKTEVTVRWWCCPFLILTAGHDRGQHLQHSPRQHSLHNLARQLWWQWRETVTSPTIRSSYKRLRRLVN